MTFLKKLLTGSLLAAACLSLNGCQTASRVWDSAASWTPTFLHPYRPDVHQGNLVTSEMVGQLQQGMSSEQVLFLLGRPLLQDQFHQDRWDYIYYLNRRSGEVQNRKLTVFFGSDGRVDHWESDKMPDETEADLMILNDKGALKRLEEKEAAAAEKTSAEAESAASGAAAAAEPKKE